MRQEITDQAASAAHGLASKGLAVNVTGATVLGVSSNAHQWHWWTSDTAAWVGMFIGAVGVAVGLVLQYRTYRMRVREFEARMRLLEAGQDDPS